MEKQKQMKNTLQLCIDKLHDKLFSLSHDIWNCPELACNETKAHDRLVRFFSEDDAWRVESNFQLATAFRATWGPFGGREGDRVLNIGFLCEYDALPGIGHACGHNLIAEVGAAGALGLKGALENESDFPVCVKITVLGTPAEEDHGGKIDLILAGAFEDIDLVFMAHPAQQDVAFLPCVALTEQQLNPDWRLHGIIKHGGVKPNIIPAYTELEFYLRTPLVKDLSALKAKAEACFRAAAVATGCQVEITYPNHAYSNILPNDTLANLYEKNGKALGIQFQEEPNNFSGSTDFGNVSFIVPGIHPFFYICTDAMNHTEEYTKAAGSEKAQLYTLRTAKALAMTAVDVLCCPDLLTQVKEDFNLAKLKQEEKYTPCSFTH
ncbi:peptidase M20 domain-containing protein 2-like isoform 3-T3 [Polymixia lowei]